MDVFKLGDRVEVLDEAVSGTIVQIEGEVITLETQEGFPLRYNRSQLVKPGNQIQVSNYEVFQIKKEKEIPRKKAVKPARHKERSAPRMEVDLHIHHLTKSTKGMGNFDMLNLQLDTAKRQLEFAISKRIPKVVFIHGVGEGVLKEELKYLFKKYPVDFYDADYQKYGLGATEVYIYQNP